jgi:hypothetical protein
MTAAPETLRTPTAAERAAAVAADSAMACQPFAGLKTAQKWAASNPQIDICQDWALGDLKYPEDVEQHHAEEFLDNLRPYPVAAAYWTAEAMSEGADADHLALLRCIAAGDTCAAGVIVGRMLKQYARSCLETRLLEVE